MSFVFPEAAGVEKESWNCARFTCVHGTMQFLCLQAFAANPTSQTNPQKSETNNDMHRATS
jgi:hypothetical protein